MGAILDRDCLTVKWFIEDLIPQCFITTLFFDVLVSKVILFVSNHLLFFGRGCALLLLNYLSQ